MKKRETPGRTWAVRLELTAMLAASAVLANGEARAENEAPPPTNPVILSACEEGYPPFCFVDQRGVAAGFSIEHGQKALLTQFSEGLASVRASGEYRRIYEKWLGVDKDASVSVGTILKYTAMVAGPLLLLLLALYSRILRRRVASHTAALRQSESQFRSLVEGAPDAIFVQTGGHFV